MQFLLVIQAVVVHTKMQSKLVVFALANFDTRRRQYPERFLALLLYHKLLVILKDAVAVSVASKGCGVRSARNPPKEKGNHLWEAQNSPDWCAVTIQASCFGWRLTDDD